MGWDCVRIEEIQVQTETRKTGKALLDSSLTTCQLGYRTAELVVKVSYQHARLGKKRQGCIQSRYLVSGQSMHTKTGATEGLRKCAFPCDFPCIVQKLWILPERENKFKASSIPLRGNVAISPTRPEATACRPALNTALVRVKSGRH